MTIEMGAFGADVTSPFVPVGVTPNYPPPRAHIAPARPGDAGSEARDIVEQAGLRWIAGSYIADVARSVRGGA